MPKWQFPNPFTDAYWHEELAFYGRPTVLPPPPMRLDYTTIQGRCDDFLSVNMRFDDTKFPRLCEHGSIWMSLTPMEVQSAALAIVLASGHVVTGGLGLGYYVLRVAAKAKVTRITVYERSQDLIDWFKAAFSDREGFDKIEFVHGDMRENCQGHKADLAFVDIYDTILPDEVVTDARLLRRRNKFGQYIYWGWERAWYDALRHRVVKSALFIPTYLLNYYKHWQSTKPLRENVLLEKSFVRKAVNATDLLYA